MVSVFWTLWFCYSISKSLSWSWGPGPVKFRPLASRPALFTEDRSSAPSQNPEKRPLRYLIVLLWSYIIFRNNSSNDTGKKIYFYYFFLPRFRCPPRMTAPLAFAYTAYAQGRLCPQHIKKDINDRGGNHRVPHSMICPQYRFYHNIAILGLSLDCKTKCITISVPRQNKFFSLYIKCTQL